MQSIERIKKTVAGFLIAALIISPAQVSFANEFTDPALSNTTPTTNNFVTVDTNSPPPENTDTFENGVISEPSLEPETPPAPEEVFVEFSTAVFLSESGIKNLTIKVNSERNAEITENGVKSVGVFNSETNTIVTAPNSLTTRKFIFEKKDAVYRLKSIELIRSDTLPRPVFTSAHTFTDDGRLESLVTEATSGSGTSFQKIRRTSRYEYVKAGSSSLKSKIFTSDAVYGSPQITHIASINKYFFAYDSKGYQSTAVSVSEYIRNGIITSAASYTQTDRNNNESDPIKMLVTTVKSGNLSESLAAQIAGATDADKKFIDSKSKNKTIQVYDNTTIRRNHFTVDLINDGTGQFVAKKVTDNYVYQVKIVVGEADILSKTGEKDDLVFQPSQPITYPGNYFVLYGDISKPDEERGEINLGYGLAFVSNPDSDPIFVVVNFPNETAVTLKDKTYNIHIDSAGIVTLTEVIPRLSVPAAENLTVQAIFGQQAAYKIVSVPQEPVCEALGCHWEEIAYFDANNNPIGTQRKTDELENSISWKKPDGTLVVFETTIPHSAAVQNILGQTPAYQLKHETRPVCDEDQICTQVEPQDDLAFFDSAYNLIGFARIVNPGQTTETQDWLNPSKETVLSLIRPDQTDLNMLKSFFRIPAVFKTTSPETDGTTETFYNAAGQALGMKFISDSGITLKNMDGTVVTALVRVQNPTEIAFVKNISLLEPVYKIIRSTSTEIFYTANFTLAAQVSKSGNTVQVASAAIRRLSLIIMSDDTEKMLIKNAVGKVPFYSVQTIQSTIAGSVTTRKYYSEDGLVIGYQRAFGDTIEVLNAQNEIVKSMQTTLTPDNVSMIKTFLNVNLKYQQTQTTGETSTTAYFDAQGIAQAYWIVSGSILEIQNRDKTMVVRINIVQDPVELALMKNTTGWDVVYSRQRGGSTLYYNAAGTSLASKSVARNMLYITSKRSLETSDVNRYAFKLVTDQSEKDLISNIFGSTPAYKITSDIIPQPANFTLAPGTAAYYSNLGVLIGFKSENENEIEFKNPYDQVIQSFVKINDANEKALLLNLIGAAAAFKKETRIPFDCEDGNCQDIVTEHYFDFIGKLVATKTSGGALTGIHFKSETTSASIDIVPFVPDNEKNIIKVVFPNLLSAPAMKNISHQENGRSITTFYDASGIILARHFKTGEDRLWETAQGIGLAVPQELSSLERNLAQTAFGSEISFKMALKPAETDPSIFNCDALHGCTGIPLMTSLYFDNSETFLGYQVIDSNHVLPDQEPKSAWYNAQGQEIQSPLEKMRGELSEKTLGEITTNESLLHAAEEENLGQQETTETQVREFENETNLLLTEFEGVFYELQKVLDSGSEHLPAIDSFVARVAEMRDIHGLTEDYKTFLLESLTAALTSKIDGLNNYLSALRGYYEKVMAAISWRDLQELEKQFPEPLMPPVEITPTPPDPRETLRQLIAEGRQLLTDNAGFFQDIQNAKTVSPVETYISTTSGESFSTTPEELPLDSSGGGVQSDNPVTPGTEPIAPTDPASPSNPTDPTTPGDPATPPDDSGNEARAAELQKIIDEETQNANSARSDNNGLAEEIRNQNEQIDSLNIEAEQLREELAGLNDSTQEQTSNHAERTSLLDEIRSLEQQLSALMQDDTAQDNQDSDMQILNAQEIARIEKKIADKKARYDELGGYMECYSYEKNNRRAEIEARLAEISRLISGVEDYILNDLQPKQSDAQKREQDAQAKIDQAQNELDNL